MVYGIHIGPLKQSFEVGLSWSSGLGRGSNKQAPNFNVLAALSSNLNPNNHDAFHSEENYDQITHY